MKFWTLLLFNFLLSPLSQAQYADYDLPYSSENNVCLNRSTSYNDKREALLQQLQSLSLFPEGLSGILAVEGNSNSAAKNIYGANVSLMDKQKFEQSISYVHRVMQYSLSSRDKEATFTMHLRKREAGQLEGKYSQALRNYYKVIALPTSPEDNLSCNGCMAKLAIQKKHFFKAMDCWNPSDSVNEDKKTRAQQVLITANLFRTLQQFDKAEKFYDSSLGIDTGTEHRVNVWYQKTIFRTAMTQHREALKDFTQLLSYLPLVKISSQHQAEIYLVGGYVYTNNKLPKEALHYFELAKDRMKYLNLEDRKALLDRLSHAYAKIGDYKKAFDEHVHMHGLEQELKFASTLSGINELEGKYQTTAKDGVIARERLTIVLAQQRHYKQGIWIASMSILLSLLLVLWYIRFYYRKHRDGKLVVMQNIGNLKELMAGDEKERDRMALNLQDGITSSLAATYSYMHTIEQLYPILAADLHFSKVKELLLDTSKEIRSIAFNLTPHILLNDGLELAIEDFSKSIFPPTIVIDIQSYGKEPEPGNHDLLFLYQIAQEYLLHMGKRVTFTELIIIIGYQKADISLTIEDNGCTVDRIVNSKVETALASLQEKVENGKGRMSIEKKSGQGAVFHIDLPLQVSS